MTDIQKEIEAIIYLSNETLTIRDLSEYFEKPIEEIENILKSLKDLKKDNGINLSLDKGIVKFVTNPECGEVIQQYFNPEVKIRKLSKSSMETLTIIAFKGPITKGEIEKIKGVSVDGSIQTLLEKKLVVSVGHKKALGNPKLYEVTEDFYGYVGVSSKEELFSMEKARFLRDYKEENIENK